MSTIFGLVYFDNRQFPNESLKVMQSAMVHWGADGVSLWNMQSVGFGHVLIAVTPESRYETMPICDSDQKIVMVAAARLDNQDELCKVFGIQTSERANTPDGRLVFLAYQRWGEHAPKHLFGDWSFAAWNSLTRKLFLARDQLGNTGLFYYHKPPLFAFSSDPNAILSLPDIPHILNEKKLASSLTLFPSERADTFWQGIHLLLPGQNLSVSPERFHTETYWRLTDAPSVRLNSDQAYVEGFLHHYRNAVRSRLRTNRPVGTTLSSGLDSGSVTAIAATEMKKRGREITAFTSTPVYPAAGLFPGARTDEWPLAQAVAWQFDNIAHLPVPAETVSPIAAVHRALSLFQSPMHAAVNMYWMFALMDEARNRGLGILLTGQLGNGGVSWSGGMDRIFFMFARGNWRKGIQSLSEWRSHHGVSWVAAIKRHILRPVLNPVWSKRDRIVRPSVSPWSAYSAIHPEFARRLNVIERMKHADFAPGRGLPIAPLMERELTMVRNGTMAGPIWHKFGAAFGLDVLDPTADVRLLEFCMGVPDEQHSFHGGERMLMRRAMNGILPPEVHMNTRRGKQAADFACRLLATPAETNAELNRLESSAKARYYLDLDAMRRAWTELQSEQTPRTARLAESLLIRGIMTGLFLNSYV